MYVVLLMTVYWCSEALPLRMFDIIFLLSSIKWSLSYIAYKLDQFKMDNYFFFFSAAFNSHYNNCLFTLTAVTSMLPIVLFPTLGILVSGLECVRWQFVLLNSIDQSIYNIF